MALLGTSPSVVATSVPGPPAYGIWHGHAPLRFSAPTAIRPETPYVFGFLTFADNSTTFVPNANLPLPSDFNESRSMPPTWSNTASLDMKAPCEPFDSQDTRVVCWVVENFRHETLEQLRSLDWGWHAIPGKLSHDHVANRDRQLQGLDLLRDNLVDLKTGTLAEYKGRGGNKSDRDDARNFTLSDEFPGADDVGDVADVAHILSTFFDRAIDASQQGTNSTTITDSPSLEIDVFIFGSRWLNGTGPGVENIRVNQGHPQGDLKELNAVRRDGGIFVRYRDKEDAHASPNNTRHRVEGGRVDARERWEALFMAFAGQMATTNLHSGDPMPESQTFGEPLRSS